jgi:hypothetical protein
MTFFNQDEETISIELTKHGRELLSRGVMKPFFYSFSDDDILYDSEKGGFSEQNKDIKNRILNETPRIKPIASKRIESDHSNMVQHEDYDNDTRGFIGNVSLNNTLASPSWDVTILEGEAVSSSNNLNSVATVECIMEYSMSFGRIIGNQDNFVNYGFNDLDIKEDGSYLRIEENNFLLHILEKNCDFNKDNFEVEVYMYEADEQNLNQLLFARQNFNIVDGLYVEQISNDLELTPDHVEYYFDLTVDREIPEEIVCNRIKNLKQENVYLEYDLKCPDREPGDIEINIYTSDLDPEKC